MVELLLSLVAGSVIAWLVSRHYYRRSSSEAPAWAKPLFEKLIETHPDEPPSEEELLKLFQESLQSGKVKPDPLLGHVACPNCNAPASAFKHKSFSDLESNRGVVIVECPSCGWSDSAEV